TQDVPPQVVLVAGVVRGDAVAGVAGQEDAFAGRHRTGGARSGEAGLPDDVLVGRPPDGQVLFLAGAQPARTAELAPLGPQREQRQEQERHRPAMTLHGKPPCQACSGWFVAGKPRVATRGLAGPSAVARFYGMSGSLPGEFPSVWTASAPRFRKVAAERL